MKDSVKKHSLCIGISLLVGFVLYNGISFYWAIICFLITIFATIGLIYCLKIHNDDDVEKFGCFWLLVFAIFTLSYLGHCDTRYITPQGGKLHIYEDCSTIKSTTVREVTEMEGYFHGYSKDCKVCMQRNKVCIQREKEIREEKRRKKKISELEDKLDEIEMQKKRILRTLERLRNGENVDTYDLRHPDSDYEEEEEDPNPYGLPSRYW